MHTQLGVLWDPRPHTRVSLAHIHTHTRVPHLHANDSVDEEDHGDEQRDVGQGLWKWGGEGLLGAPPNNTLSPLSPLCPQHPTWKDLTKVQSSVRMPSPLDNSFTNRMTRNSRKKVMEMRELSSELCRVYGEGGTGEVRGTPKKPPRILGTPLGMSLPHRRDPRSVARGWMNRDERG